MDEVNIHAIDVRNELRIGIEPRFDFAPFVAGTPVANQFLQLRQLRPLRRVGFFIRPARRLDAPPKIGEVGVRDVDAERPDFLANGSYCRQ